MVIKLSDYVSQPTKPKRHATRALLDAFRTTIRTIRAAVKGATDATEKAESAWLERESRVSVPRSIFEALLADSRALAEVEKKVRKARLAARGADPEARELCLGSDASVADLAEAWAVRLPGRRRTA